VTSLPEMIRKITSLPAHVYGLTNKGRIAVGMDADICVFDPELIIDRAEFTNPHPRAEGLAWVIVEGVVAAENAVCTGATPGKLLRRKMGL
jgi:N-acyl-D-aspartate/D-glutamate deacylase